MAQFPLPLPFELLHRIMYELQDDLATLLVLRQASRALESCATQRAFHKIVIRGTTEHATAMQEMLYSGSAALRYVKEVELIGVDETVFSESCDDEQGLNDQVLEAFTDLWPALAKLSVPSVTIRLRSDALLLSSQHFFLEGITQFPPGVIKSLAIQNFIPYADPILSSPALAAILSHLEHLLLYVNSRMEFYMLQPEINSYDDFWTDAEAHWFFSIFTSSLKSLSIRTTYFPIWCGHPWDIVYPRLETLYLTGCLLRPDVNTPDPQPWDASADQFILSHRHTLRDLTLVDCCVFAQQDPYGDGCYRYPTNFKSIGSVWRTFRTELTNLRKLDVRFVGERDEQEPCPWLDDNQPDLGGWKGYYMSMGQEDAWFFDEFDEVVGPTEKPDVHDDDKALVEWRQSVKERNQPGCASNRVVDWGSR